MSVGLLLVCHDEIGQQQMQVVNTILGESARNISSISVPSGLTPDHLGEYADQIKQAIINLDSGYGVLILADLFGATPCNLAHYFASEHQVKIVSGLNLPMLLRVLNYSDTSLSQLADIASEGGKRGICVGVPKQK